MLTGEQAAGVLGVVGGLRNTVTQLEAQNQQLIAILQGHGLVTEDGKILPPPNAQGQDPVQALADLVKEGRTESRDEHEVGKAEGSE